jgi:protein phosphatase
MANPGTMSDAAAPFSVLTARGTQRKDDGDACGWHAEGSQLLVVIADGVSGEEGAKVASQMAIDVTLRTYRESPAAWDAGKRLYRAAQQANIEIHDRALVVTELRRMSSTLTAVVVDEGIVHAAHVGHSRLYSIRAGHIMQMTKDHTVAGVRRRMGLPDTRPASEDPEHGILTRSLGKELIAPIDRIQSSVVDGEVLLLCTDGLYDVLSDDEMAEILATKDPALACRALVEAANARGTPDNLTAAVIHVSGAAPGENRSSGWRTKPTGLLDS